MISIANIHIGENKEELLHMYSEECEFLCRSANLDSYVGRRLPWHWHAAFEIDYIEEGELEFRVADRTYLLKKGEAIFINSNILHDIKAKEGIRKSKLYSHLFDMNFLSGAYNSIFERKYFLPVLKCHELQAAVIRPDSRRRLQMLEKVLHVIELCEREAFGYEFDVRSELCGFWKMLLEETKEVWIRSKGRKDADEERLKSMIAYIMEHYGEKVTLKSIAERVNVSERECSRCFKRCLGMSPMNYLNDYRVQMAARMLLQTNDSILSIREKCGFHSDSYFGKVFQGIMRCSPREYRKGR